MNDFLAGRRLGRPMRWICTLAPLLLMIAPAAVRAQLDNRAVPRQDYFLAMSLYQEGDFASALNGFRVAGGSGVRSTVGRWVDSICYYSMMGECQYQMGDLPAALESYNAALRLLVAHRDWLLRVQFPAQIEAETQGPRPPINWGNPARPAVMGRYPDKLATLQGNPNPEQALLQGGVIAPPELFPLYVGEVVRCAAQALRRRAEIMGPTCPYDPLTEQLVTALARRPAPPNHWSQSWVGVLLGLAYVSDGKPAQAIAELRQALLVSGQFDHALTGIALLELGKLATRQNRLDVASSYFLEATYTAAAFQQYEVAEEAFRLGAAIHLARGGADIYAPLLPASEWARRKSRFLEASLQVSLAEQFSARHDPVRAGGVIAQARRTIGRGELNASTLAARLHYQQALVAFQAGNLDAGGTDLTTALGLQRKASTWLFQIALADKLYLSGTVSPRSAEQLFSDLLREPSSSDWVYQPMETLALLTTPHGLPLEHWFEVALERKDLDQALEVADRARRHRFHATLPLGGRLLALRWLLEAPVQALDEPALLQRRDLLARYPRYGELAAQAQQVRTQLTGLPLRADNEETTRQQTGLFDQLAKLSTAQEIVLREIALQREATQLVFPPLKSVKELRQALPEGRRVLAFFATSRALHAFLFDRENYAHKPIEATAKLRADLVQLLRQLGHYDWNVAIGPKELADPAWKETARKLLDQIVDTSQQDVWTGVEELVVVPDGPLWYLPFEALPADREGAPLITRMRVRVVPTVSLVLPDDRGRPARADTAVVAGRLLPRDEAGFADQSVSELQRVLPGVVRLGEPLPATSSLLANRCQRLIVMQSIDDLDRGPYLWSPLPLDRGKPGSTLADWNVLPWGGPDQILLPGYTTAAESALKRGGSGEEVFLSVCGLMSTGSRTLLLSRWRVGGQSSLDLLREFTQELPHAAAADAWQRSVLLNMQNELDPEREPRLKSFTSDSGLTARHPFFWSGYLLVDTGSGPIEDEAEP